MFHFLLILLIIVGTTFSSLSVTFHHFYSKLRVLQVVVSARYNILMGHMMGDDSTVHHIDNRLDFSYIPAVSIPKGMDVYMNRFQLGSKPHLNTSYAGSIWFLFHNQHYKLTFPVGLAVIGLYQLH